MTSALLISIFAALAIISAVVRVVAGGRRIGRLSDVPLSPNACAVRVSVIVTALDEAATIERAMRSLLALDYPNLEIIVINDRSSDATPQILESLGREYSRLKVIHIRCLPSGWLGKNHALHIGAKHASGDFLIFSDADVIFSDGCIERAVAYCQEHGLAHLSLFPHMPIEHPLLAMLMLQFGFGFLLRFEPWKIAASDRHYLGQGAFNMVRRDAYVEAGGHAAIPMEVIDDMMLGWLMKHHGFRQNALLGQEFISVRWYHSPMEMFMGLRKNVFAGFDYSLGKLVAGSLVFGMAGSWPWLGLWITSGVAWWVNCCAVVGMTAFFYGMAKMAGWSRWCLVYLPIITPLTLVMWWQACLVTIWQGGIYWRGTFYSLPALRNAHAARMRSVVG